MPDPDSVTDAVAEAEIDAFDDLAGDQLYHEPPADGPLLGFKPSLLSGFPHVKLLETLELPFGPGLPDHVVDPAGIGAEYTSQCWADPESSCRR